MASGGDERRYDPTDKAREQAYTLKEFQDFFSKKGHDEEWILARWARSPSAGLPMVTIQAKAKSPAAPKIEAKEESSASEEEPASSSKATTKSSARLKRQKQKKRDLKAGGGVNVSASAPRQKGAHAVTDCTSTAAGRGLRAHERSTPASQM